MDSQTGASAKQYQEGPAAARKFEGVVKAVMTTPLSKRQKPPRVGRKKRQKIAS